MYKVKKGYYFYTHVNPKNGDILKDGDLVDPADYPGKKAKLISSQHQKLTNEDGTPIIESDLPTVKEASKAPQALSTGSLKQEHNGPKEDGADGGDDSGEGSEGEGAEGAEGEGAEGATDEGGKGKDKDKDDNTEKKAVPNAPENKQIGEAPENKGLSADQEQ